MIGSSSGRSITRKKGLTTRQCFDFLLTEKRIHTSSTFIAFFFSYDVTMMLRDLPPNAIAKLYKFGYVTWKDYKISNTMRKFITIKDLRDNASVRINDTAGFFQCSFVKALESWKIGSPEMIADMKDRRSQFTSKDIPDMLTYCLAECKLLVDMLCKLEDSMSEAGITPAGWYGAGCIASGILRQNGIKHYRRLDTELEPKVNDALLRAYFGGRVETFAVGQYGNCYSHDVRSAYPHAISSLPTSHGEWKYSTKATIPQYGVCYVSWQLPKGYNIGPFPHRSSRRIHYPANGTGYYHAIEVRAAMVKYGSYIKLHYSYGFEPSESGTTPFAFVHELYRHRAIAKREGRASQLSIKLGLNSLYGKMAQGYGYKGSVPPFRTYLWAGQITATTRARILDLLAANQEDTFIGFATDGVMLRSRGNGIQESEELGDWEVSMWDDLFVCQPGFYHGNSEGQTVTKTRGFAPKEVNWEEVREGYEKYGPYYIHELMTTRFIGLGAAIQRGNLSLRGRWLTERRTITLYPQRKYVTHKYRKGHVFAEPTPFTIMRGDVFNVASEPYVPKGGQFREMIAAKNSYENLHEQPSYPFT